MVVALFFCSNRSNAQVCTCRISGTVKDSIYNAPIPEALIWTTASVMTGTSMQGAFTIGGLCKGEVTIFCAARGYDTLRKSIDAPNDSVIVLLVNPLTKRLQEVTINAARNQDISSFNQVKLRDRALFETRGSSLGETIKELPGLNAVQTGPSISKPMIHGLHSNRVLIINNGVRQEGQQWGAEHAPEIDPFVANQIETLKGAAGVRYGSDALGGVVKLSPGALPIVPGWGGDVYAVGASNGMLGTLSAVLQGAAGGKLTGFSYRLQGTYKRGGSFNAPNYVLKNTGLEETNGSAEIGYRSKRLEIGLYYSLFRTKNGIFEGAHVGNIADLYVAFNRSKPVSPSVFSFDINRSFQYVEHDLVKGSLRYNFDNGGRMEAVFARQRDLRDEYDISLPYTTDPEILKKPQVSFQLVTHTAELIYSRPVRQGWSGSFGISGGTQGNVFRGIRYLVPNFRTYTGGAFAIQHYELGRFNFEAGLRYDYRWLRVYRLNNSTLQAYSATFDYSNVSGMVGATYKPSSKLTLFLNSGSAWRAPSVNEMYIHGIHFSDARYQNGDSSLATERSWNTSFSVAYRGGRVHFDVEAYYNRIANYIYERPLLQPITLISGAYPAFQFTQDEATIHGLDAMASFDITKRMAANTKATLVRGRNLSQQNDLLYMPADRLVNGLSYSWQKLGFMHNVVVTADNVTVLRQWRVPENSDYVAPPAGYSLYNASVAFETSFYRRKLSVAFTVNNVTNVSYRDYLNHFRYYSDELGVNFVIRTKYSF